MPGIMGTVIVIAIIAVAAALAARSLWKAHKAGDKCTGNCAACGGCHHAGQKRNNSSFGKEAWAAENRLCLLLAF